MIDMFSRCLDDTGVVAVLLLGDEPRRAQIAAVIDRADTEPLFVSQAAGRRAANSALANAPCDVLVLASPSPDALERDLIHFRASRPGLPVVVVDPQPVPGACARFFAAGAQDYFTLVDADADPRGFVRSLVAAIARHKFLARAEQAGRESGSGLERYRTLVEGNPDGILLVDEAGVVRFANRAALHILGRPEQDVVGHAFGHPVIHEGRSVLTIDREGFETTVVEMHMNEVSQGSETAYLATIRDVSEQARALSDQAQHVRLERVKREIVSLFVISADPEADAAVPGALERLGAFCNASRCLLYVFTQDGARLGCVAEWTAEGVPEAHEACTGLEAAEFAWLARRLELFEAVLVPDPEALPQDAASLLTLLRLRNVASMVAVGFGYGDGRRAFLALEAVGGDRMWSEEEIGLMKEAGAVISAAVRRKAAVG